MAVELGQQVVAVVKIVQILTAFDSFAGLIVVVKC